MATPDFVPMSSSPNTLFSNIFFLVVHFRVSVRNHFSENEMKQGWFTVYGLLLQDMDVTGVWTPFTANIHVVFDLSHVIVTREFVPAGPLAT